MHNKMTEARRSVLQAAAAREDRLVAPPANLRPAAVKALAGKWLDAGWVKEVKARNGAPIWRKDAESGAGFALKLSALGVKTATALLEISAVEGASVTRNSMAEATPSRSNEARIAEQPVPAPESSVSLATPTQFRPPRPASKLGRVLEMLSADAGATIEELTATTGWLEHTTRAALTGLRHRGYELSLARKERDGASVYRTASLGGAAGQ